jgi:hypothetical protein
MRIRYILLAFGMFFIPFWYVARRKNLATLIGAPILFVHRSCSFAEMNDEQMKKVIMNEKYGTLRFLFFKSSC